MNDGEGGGEDWGGGRIWVMGGDAQDCGFESLALFSTFIFLPFTWFYYSEFHRKRRWVPGVLSDGGGQGQGGR